MAGDTALMTLLRAIAGGEATAAARLLAEAPGLARASLLRGATRATAEGFFLEAIGHHVYQGDTALHVAAAAHAPDLVRLLLAQGAAVGARNRRGAQPLHLAADGAPGTPRWRPEAQAATIACLLAAGADPDAVDRSGVAPLHRAVRTRCALAAGALLAGGANPRLKNGSGSTPLGLARRTTGRSGSGSPEAKAQQAELLELLRRRGVAR